jgi:hypothetical protein
MKLKNSDLEAIISDNSYLKLFRAEFDDILLVLEIRRQYAELQTALNAYSETKRVLLERFCDKDPNTQKPIVGSNGRYSFVQNPQNMRDFQDKFNELLNTEIEVDVQKVKISSSALQSVAKWSGAELNIIYPFVEIVVDETKNKQNKGKTL